MLDGKPARDVLLEVAEKDSKKSISKKRVLDLGQLTTHNVPTDCFSDDKGIVYLAQGKEVANQYGLFLRNNAEIQEVTFCLPEVRTEDYSIALWLRRIGCGWSAFDGGDRDLGGVSGSLFGVLEDGEATQKLVSPTLKQILEVSKPFVPDASRNDFECRIRKLYQE
ncbi:hypothetical protein J4427_01060 [Candidatus Woesearchaeota archaeon]|nr:hypothetical protein [Candidatus Woesearchaeota archaeon]